MKFSEKAKYLRISAELTQQELSKNLGITASAIGYLENGKREPTGSTLIAYAKFFDISIDELTGIAPGIEDGIIHPATVSPAPTLTQEEKQLLETFRKLNIKNRMHVSAYAEVRLEEQERGTRRA